jgi:hypothetical protein
MTLGRPPRGGDAHTSAVERLEAARDQQSRLRQAADDARGTSGEETADDELKEAGDRAEARETWLAWVERGF